jgi:uncharacterized protein (TIGR02284 family)
MELQTGAPLQATTKVLDPQVTGQQTVLQRLLSTCRESEAGLSHVAEHVQNRGVKLLLKAYAQQRASSVRELETLLHTLDHPNQDATPTGEVHRGLNDIGTAMTLGRKNRQHVALADQLELERRLLESYATALTVGLSSPAYAVIERQRNRAAQVYDWLEELDQEGQSNLVVRLFEQTAEADAAVDQLRQAGFGEGEIQALEVERMPVYHETPAIRARSQWETIAAGAISGGIVGVLVGLAIGIVQTFVPNSVQTSVSPLVMTLTSALIGAAFGGVFGWLIGRNKVEDDAFVYEDALARGEKLVVVHADAARTAQAEAILKIHHERELDKA